MFQCGMFIPVDDVSEFCWFDNILSDIGDNQSIDNQLSTYSYRLSRMKYFLEILSLLDISTQASLRTILAGAGRINGSATSARLTLANTLLGTTMRPSESR